MEIDVRSIQGHNDIKEITIKDNGVTLESGTLNLDEQQLLASQLMGAAYDLMQDSLSKELLGVIFDNF